MNDGGKPPVAEPGTRLAAARVVGEQRERAAVHRELGLLRGGVVGDTVLGHAGRVDHDHGGARVLVRVDDR
ncbi:MAG: hypothetical protein ACO3EK_15445, partial [Alphaproteobacteria bacterium]